MMGGGARKRPVLPPTMSPTMRGNPLVQCGKFSALALPLVATMVCFMVAVYNAPSEHQVRLSSDAERIAVRFAAQLNLTMLCVCRFSRGWRLAQRSTRCCTKHRELSDQTWTGTG